MSRRYFINNASVVELVSSIGTSDTTVQVTDASSFPATFPWAATIDAGQATAECVLVTAASGTTLTLTRGYDGTAAQAHAANASFAHTATKADYDEANQHVNATTNVHGVAGELVGTSATQTLTNKTLTAPAINDPTIGGIVHGFPPPGVISPFAGLVVPSGWLLCDGRAVSRSTYADLWSALHITQAGATWVADGSGGYTVTVTDTSNLAVGMKCFIPGGASNGVIGSVKSSTSVGVLGSGFSTGTHDLVVAPFGVGDGSTTFNLPDLTDNFPIGASTGTAANPLGLVGGAEGHSHTLSDAGQAQVALLSTVAKIRMVPATGWTSTQQMSGTANGGNNVAGNGAALTGSTDANSDTRPPFQAVYYIVKT